MDSNLKVSLSRWSLNRVYKKTLKIIVYNIYFHNRLTQFIEQQDEIILQFYFIKIQ